MVLRHINPFHCLFYINHFLVDLFVDNCYSSCFVCMYLLQVIVIMFVCLFVGNCYSSDFKSLHGLMSKYPQLLKYSSSIDHFQPWPFEAYVKMASVWLQDERSKVMFSSL